MALNSHACVNLKSSRRLDWSLTWRIGSPEIIHDKSCDHLNADLVSDIEHARNRRQWQAEAVMNWPMF